MREPPENSLFTILGYTDVEELSFEATELRALIELMSRRDNFLTNRIIELQDALSAVLAAGGNANARLNTLPVTWMSTQPRNRRAAMDEYKALLDDGSANV